MPQIQSVAIQPKLWDISGIPPPQHHTKKLEMLSYPHKIDCTRLTNVCFGSFKGSETLETYQYIFRQFNDSVETVHRQ